MECIEPGAISLDDLLAAAVGDAGARTAQHLAACTACAAIVAAYAREDTALRARLYRVECPDAHSLGELALGLLDLEAALAVRRHVADCRHCTSELRMLTAELVGNPLAEMLKGPGLIRRIIARLEPSPVLGFALSGVRGSSSSEPAVYEAEDVTVSVTVQPEGQGASRAWTVLGLVDIAGAPPDTADATLLPATGEPIALQLDEIGNFSAGGLQPGTYSLELALPGRVIVVPDIAIGPPGDKS